MSLQQIHLLLCDQAMWEIQPSEHLYLEALCFVLDGLGFHCCWIDRDQTIRCVRFHEASRFAPNIVRTRMSILKCNILDEIIRTSIQISLIFKNELAALLLSLEDGNIHIHRPPILNASLPTSGHGQTYPTDLLDGSTTNHRKKRRQDDIDRSKPTANRHMASDNLMSHLLSSAVLNQPVSTGLGVGLGSSSHVSSSSASMAIAPATSIDQPNQPNQPNQPTSLGLPRQEGDASEDVLFTCESGPDFQTILSGSEALRIQHDTINRIQEFHRMWRSAPPHPNPPNPHPSPPSSDVNDSTDVTYFLRAFVSKQERYLYSLYHSIHGS